MKKNNAEEYSMVEKHTQTLNDNKFSDQINNYFEKSIGTNLDKLKNFCKFVPRQTISHFLAKNELFKLILNSHGHIVECGVYLGGGLMTWAELSAIYEPYNHTRRIIGFDTFSGFPTINKKDKSSKNTKYTNKGGLSANSLADITDSVKLYDLNRPIGHINRVELVEGDATITIPKFLKDNEHTVISLLYLDFDLYEPTKIALETFLPRMSKGSIIVFDELNQAQWPGETLAVMDTIGIKNLRIQRFPFTPQLSYAIID